MTRLPPRHRVAILIPCYLHGAITNNVFLFLDHLELRSSSFTLGNASKLSFPSLNHDLLAVLDDEALIRGVNPLTSEVVDDAICILCLY